MVATSEQVPIKEPPRQVAGRGDWLAVLRILLIVQGLIALVSTLEVTVVGAATGGVLMPVAVANLVGAAITLRMAKRISTGKPRVRKTVVLLQAGWLIIATFDLGLSIILTQRPLELVPLLTRGLLPVAILRMLRSEDARELFGVGPTRRQRRKARKAQRVAGRMPA